MFILLISQGEYDEASDPSRLTRMLFWSVIFVFLLSGMLGWYQGVYVVVGISTFQSAYLLSKNKVSVIFLREYS